MVLHLIIHAKYKIVVLISKNNKITEKLLAIKYTL